MNGKIVGNTPFEEVFIPYAPDDSGNSIGVALYLHHNILERPYNVKKETSSYLGRSWSDKEIKEILDEYQVSYIVPDDLYLTTVKLIKDENIVGWFQGRSEFGQRALGNRSILATPLEKDIKRKINAKIKYREDFRPFAPSILEERVRDFFDIAENVKSPYMEQVFPVKKEMQSKMPAVVHNDGTGRVHMVNKKTNTEFYRLIEAFESLTAIPILLNTSFNVSGEPIVDSPEDALRTFTTSGLDVLVIGKYIITKK
jgi:carbamoyltransferase